MLTDAQRDSIALLEAKHRREAKQLRTLNLYYNLEQTVRHIGMAVAPELRDFTTIVSIPRLVVDEPVLRQKVQGIYRLGNTTKEDPNLRQAWNANNLESELSILQTEEKIFGRAFLSVSGADDDKDLPRITVESPQALTVDVDRGMIRRALRIYRNDRNQPVSGTLYEPNTTSHLMRDSRNGGWTYNTDAFENPVDEHNLGIVPIVGFINRRRAGELSLIHI